MSKYDVIITYAWDGHPIELYALPIGERPQTPYRHRLVAQVDTPEETGAYKDVLLQERAAWVINPTFHPAAKSNYYPDKPDHKYQVTLYIKAELQIRANNEDEIKIAIEQLAKVDALEDAEFSLPLKHTGHHFILRVELGEITQTG